MNRILVTLISLALASGFSARAATGTGGVNSGGGPSSSASYALDASLGNIAGNSCGGSVSNCGGGSVIQPSVTSLGLTAAPASVNEGGVSQLSGTATMDDQTVTSLTGTDIAWSLVAYPFQSLGSNGALTAVSNVYAVATGTVNGAYLGVGGGTSVAVLGPYADAGIPDSWFVQYFGAAPNPLAAPNVDADGTGQDNLYKYIADLDPTNPASVFEVVAVSNQPPGTAVYFPSSPNRVYALLWTTNLVSGAWTNLPCAGPVPGDGCVFCLSDTNLCPQRLYRVQVQVP